MNRFFVIAILLSLTLCALPRTVHSAENAAPGWDIRTSLKYDALCFISAVSDQEFYNRNYFRERAIWQDRLGPADMDSIYKVAAAISNVRLCYPFSFVRIGTLDDFVAVLGDTARLRVEVNTGIALSKDFRVEATQKDLNQIIALRGTLIYIFREMKRQGWEEEWRLYEAKMTADIRRLKNVYDAHPASVIAQAALNFLGTTVPQGADSSSRVYYLYYSCPNGFKLPYNMFATWHIGNAQWFFSTHLHEYLHLFSVYKPELKAPYDALLAASPQFSKQRDTLVKENGESDDEFFIVAAEAYLSERLGFRSAAEVQGYLQDSNGGLMKFSRLIYELLRDRYSGRPTSYEQFVKDVVYPDITPQNIESKLSAIQWK